MKMIISLFLALSLWSCKKPVSSSENVKIVAHNVHSQLGRLQGVKVVLNDSVIGVTDALGEFRVPSLLETDSLRLEDADFTFERKLVDESSQFCYYFLASKIQSSQDSAALSFLKSLQNSGGIMPSIEDGTLVSTYDQALAVIAFCVTGQKEAAEGVLDFFEGKRINELEQGLGGFYQFRSPSGVPTGNRWMGDNAWLLLAVQNYHRAFSTAIGKYNKLEISLINWLGSLEDPFGDGLYGGYLPNGDTIHKITEGNIDAFAVLSSADIRASILRHLQADKWDAIDENLMAWPTNPPYKFALDCYTWGYCAFPDYTESARTKLTKFAVTKQSTKTGETISGYCFDEDQDVLWFEGTGQVAVAHWVAGDAQAASLVLDEMKKGWVQTSSGEWGLPYAANSGTGYGSDPLWATANTDACISSTVWYLLASYRYNPMAGSRTKQLDAGPEFWR